MHQTDHAPAQASDRTPPDYDGEGRALFALALKTALLTLITLGVYRFWAKTRIRRYIWSSAALDGARFEYTGTGLEKFLGFLVATVFLAVYLGLVQIALTFFGLTLFSEPATPDQAIAQGLAFALTGLAVLPFVFFAQYRARRYRLGRTRWRGIRFGMDPAAWGYALRALGYYSLAVLTLGLLLPLATYRLEKYMTDRSHFGDARFTLGGRWTGLYPAMKHLLFPLLLLVAGTALSLALGRPALAAILPPVALVWLAIGVVHYNVQSFAYLTRHTRLGGDICFDARPRTGTVVLTYVTGSLVIAAGVAVLGGLVSGLIAIAFGGVLQMTGTGSGAQEMPVAALAGPAVAAILGYLAVILISGAAAMALIVQPILAHYIATMTVSDLHSVDAIRQRSADRGADAEGFADALDIGGAI